MKSGLRQVYPHVKLKLQEAVTFYLCLTLIHKHSYNADT